MTTTPERQHEAVDDLVLSGMEAVPFMFAHLRDYRRLATTNVRFLNTQPHFEKYFLTEAVFVDELTVRFLCGKTGACDRSLGVYQPQEKAQLISALLQWCTQQAAIPKAVCRLPAPVGKEMLIEGRVDP